MNENEEILNAQIVMRRALWYRDQFRRAMWLLLLLTVAVIVETMVITALVARPSKTVYFSVTPDMRVMRLTPLSKPIVEPDGLRKWAADAVVKAFSYDFVHYQQQMNDLEPLFTREGYDQFLAALKASQNLDLVRARRYVVSAAPVEPPTIVAQGEFNGVFTWKVSAPIMVQYSSASDNKTQSLKVLLTIKRVYESRNPQGIAIDQFITRQK